MISRRTFALSGIAAAVGLTKPVAAVGINPRPVVIELFTSQGCSSCPPADEYLADLATHRDVVALAYHIDYWDYIGWKDPFADPAFTARQRVYGRSLRKRTIYKPQIVVDGEVDAVGSRRWEVDGLIEQRLRANQAERLSVPVHLVRDGGGLTVDVPDAGIPGPADLMLVAYDGRHVTEVRRGENGGRTLVDVNVVRVLRKIGTFAGEGATLTVPDGPWSDRDGGAAVLLQARHHGPIWGAASVTL